MLIIIIAIIFGLTLITVGGAVGVYFLTKKEEEEEGGISYDFNDLPPRAPSAPAPSAPTPAPSAPTPTPSPVYLTCNQAYPQMIDKTLEMNNTSRQEMVEMVGVEMVNAITDFYYGMEEPICNCIGDVFNEIKISNIDELINMEEAPMHNGEKIPTLEQEQCLKDAMYNHLNNWANLDGIVNASLNLLINERLIRKNYGELINSEKQHIFRIADAIYFGHIANKIGTCVYSKLKTDYSTPRALIDYANSLNERLISDRETTQDEIYALIKRYIRQCISNQNFCSQTELSKLDEIVRYYANQIIIERQNNSEYEVSEEHIIEFNAEVNRVINEYHKICVADFSSLDTINRV